MCRYSLDGMDLVEVIVYEGMRIFRDRLVGTDATKSFDMLLQTVMKSVLSYRGAACLTSCLCAPPMRLPKHVFSHNATAMHHNKGVESGEAILLCLHVSFRVLDIYQTASSTST